MARPRDQPTAASVLLELESSADPEKAAFYPRFFRAGPGEYGEGDRFLGVIVPVQRKVARRRRELPLEEVELLLESPWHEARLTGLLILVERFRAAAKRGDDDERHEIAELYLSRLDRVDNWDLVDSSAPTLLGEHLEHDPRRAAVLDELAASGDLWRQRIALLATLHFIRQGDFADTLRLAERLLDHPHDLIHKASGWMLREIGKRDEDAMLGFLRRHYDRLPRTTLRYAIEKLPEARRKAALRGEI